MLGNFIVLIPCIMLMNQIDFADPVNVRLLYSSFRRKIFLLLEFSSCFDFACRMFLSRELPPWYMRSCTFEFGRPQTRR